MAERACALEQDPHPVGSDSSKSALETGASEVGASANPVIRRLLACLEAELCDPDLCPQRLAQRLRLSVRTLHAALAGSGTTVARLMLVRRLDRCRALLEAEPERRISEVAFACGFNDAAHFSRTFKARFGMAPRALRDQNRVTPADTPGQSRTLRSPSR